MSEQVMKLFVRVTDEMLETGYQRCVAEAQGRGSTAGLKALELEYKGGDCHFCGAPFRAIHVKNMFADFTYYEPGCQCYKRCTRVPVRDMMGRELGSVTGCGRWMVEERMRSLRLCLRCCGEPVDRNTERPAARDTRVKKKQRRDYSGRDAAAGPDR